MTNLVQANKLFKTKKYNDALRIYEKIVESATDEISKQAKFNIELIKKIISKKEFYSNWDYNDVTNCRIIQAKYHENTYVDCEKARTTLLDIQILDFDSYEEASRFKNGNL